MAIMARVITPQATDTRSRQPVSRQPLLTSEDWWAVWVGGLLMAAVVFRLVPFVPTVGGWTDQMLATFDGRIVGLLVLGLGIGVLTGVAVRSTGGPLFPYLRGFAALFALAVLAYVLAQQSAVRAAGFPYAFWALALGMLISNSIGTPRWLQAAARGELFIKTGLVLLGAEILFGRNSESRGSGIVCRVARDTGRHPLHVSIRHARAPNEQQVFGHRDCRSDVGLRSLSRHRRRGRVACQDRRADARGGDDADLHRRHDGRDAPRHPRQRHGHDRRRRVDRGHDRRDRRRRRRRRHAG